MSHDSSIVCPSHDRFSIRIRSRAVAKETRRVVTRERSNARTNERTNESARGTRPTREDDDVDDDDARDAIERCRGRAKGFDAIDDARDANDDDDAHRGENARGD